MKKELYLIDSIEGARRILKIKNNNFEVITLNYSLNNYLKMRNINSKNIYEFFENSEIKLYLKKTHSILTTTLDFLDKDLNKINAFKKYNVKKFFHPIFSSQYQKTYYAFFLIKKLFDKKINLKKYNVTIFYNPNLLKNKFTIYELIEKNKIFHNIKIQKLSVNSEGYINKIMYLYLDKNNIMKYFVNKIKMLWLKIEIKFGNFLSKKKHKILLLNYDYDLLKYFKNKNYKIIFFEELKNINVTRKYTKIALKILEANKSSLNNDILYSIRKFLIKNQENINLNLMYEVYKQKLLKYIIWKYPVAFNTNQSLIVRNNLKKKKIIGFQHGAHYLIKKNYFHFDQDFYNCNYWISYYTSEKDFKKLYRNRKKSCKIINQNLSTKINFKKKIKRKEILYPLRQIHNLYASGLQDKIVYSKQLQIIKILESLRKTYIIKTVFPVTRENCAFIDVFKNLKYAKIISGISLKNYLDRNEHEIIVLDNYETTLYDSIEFSNKTKIILIDSENDFGDLLNTEFKKNLSKKVFFIKKVSLLKKSIKDKVNLSDINQNNKISYTLNNFDVLNNILN